MRARLVALIAVMGALGNVLGALSIPIPVPVPYPRVELCFSSLATLFMAVSIGPLAGAVTGALGTIVSTIRLGNPFIPLGHTILGFVAGYASKKFRPFTSGIIGEIAETPWIWFSVIFWAYLVAGVPVSVLIPIITLINIKAFFDVAASLLVCEILLMRREVKDFLKRLKE